MRLFTTVYYQGVMPGPHYLARSRLVPAERRLCWTRDAASGEWWRTTSSIHAMVNHRAGLARDQTPVAPHPAMRRFDTPRWVAPVMPNRHDRRRARHGGGPRLLPLRMEAAHDA